MKSLLNALQEGRFVELPETNKEKALHYLATLIEAVPDLNAGTDKMAEAVSAGELQFNTGIVDWGGPVPTCEPIMMASCFAPRDGAPPGSTTAVQTTSLSAGW